MYEFKHEYKEEILLLNIYENRTVLLGQFGYTDYINFRLVDIGTVSINGILLDYLDPLYVEEIIKNDRESFLDLFTKSKFLATNNRIQYISDVIKSICIFNRDLIKDDFLELLFDVCKLEQKYSMLTSFIFSETFNKFLEKYSDKHKSRYEIVNDILERYIFKYYKIFTTEFSFHMRTLKIYLIDNYGKIILFCYFFDGSYQYRLDEHFPEYYYSQDKNVKYFTETYNLKFQSILSLLHDYCSKSNHYHMEFERMVAQYRLFKFIEDVTVRTDNFINVIFAPKIERYTGNKNTKTFDMVKIEFSVIRNGKSNKELIAEYKKHQKYIIDKLLQKISENKRFINYGVPIEYLKLDRVTLTSVDTFHHTFILKTEKLEEV